MGSVFYVIAIMGCGDGQTQCAQQRIETARYASAAQCQAAMPAALMRNTDIDFRLHACVFLCSDAAAASQNPRHLLI